MKFAYTIIYVESVKDTLVFYQKAFKLKPLFLHESETYGELDTGETKLAFAANTLGSHNQLNIRPNKLSDKAPGFEIAFTDADVAAGFHYAIEHGAIAIKAPETKPWGQIVAYVKDINGILVEICSPMD